MPKVDEVAVVRDVVLCLENDCVDALHGVDEDDECLVSVDPCMGRSRSSSDQVAQLLGALWRKMRTMRRMRSARNSIGGTGRNCARMSAANWSKRVGKPAYLEARPRVAKVAGSAEAYDLECRLAVEDVCEDRFACR